MPTKRTSLTTRRFPTILQNSFDGVDKDWVPTSISDFEKDWFPDTPPDEKIANQKNKYDDDKNSEDDEELWQLPPNLPTKRTQW